MKIALVGYGKMGKAIEKIAIDRGHTIKTIVDKNDSSEKLGNVDVTINFCTPKTAVNNITNSFNQNIPVVSGTTGLSALPGDSASFAISALNIGNSEAQYSVACSSINLWQIMLGLSLIHI